MLRVSFLLFILCCTLGLWAVELPVTDVVLFSSGVGYVQRTGTVHDNATVEMTFKPGQVNDLLKSMVLLDLDGGQVGAVTYGAKDPLSKTLQAFAVNLTDNPTLGQLLNRLRGVAVEINGAVKLSGKILGVETKKKEVGDKVIDVEVLDLLADDGLHSLRLDDSISIRVLDERLNKELQDALQVLATGLDNQRKPVVINFTGAGDRRVLVGYLTEAPLWKTSYRLMLDDKQNVFQGWAVVENTSDADWKDVHLTLVSGRPISFIEDLYTPLYLPRPLYQPELFASLAPVDYAADLQTAVPDTYRTSNNYNNNNYNNNYAGPEGDTGVPTLAPSSQQTNNQLQFLPQGVGNVNGLIGLNSLLVRAGVAGSSVESAAEAKNLGEAFSYTIKDAVTLPRQQSALLPIVSGSIDASKVSIYNPQVQADFPLYGLRVKNTTGEHLMGGPITIFDGSVYAGDAVFEDLQPGEERLVSYAVNLGVACECKTLPGPEEITSFKLVKGNLFITRKCRQTTNYIFKVKDGRNRLLLVEHPRIGGSWLSRRKRTRARQTCIASS